MPFYTNCSRVFSPMGRGASQAMQAVGGQLSYVTSGGVTYALHRFANTGMESFTVVSPGNADVLVVGGGGGAGTASGGGGAGGLIYKQSNYFQSGNYLVTVGLGGSGTTVWGGNGTNGTNSSVGALVAQGGGYGAHGGQGGTGGSGGGSGYSVSTAGQANQKSQSGDSGTFGFGNNGGLGVNSNPGYPGGGGGGAGAVGSNGSGNNGGNGGIGLALDITGSSVYYAGGGGGGSRSATGGTGGLGGGGNGGSGNQVGGNGTANTGGGGGGAGGNNTGHTGGSGGSGIVIIRYPVTTALTTSNLIINYDASTLLSHRGEFTTNVAPNPNDFSNWSGNLFNNWINAAVTTNASIAPDGTQTADRLGDGYSRFTNSISVSANQTYTCSVYVRNVSLTGFMYLHIAFGNNGSLVSEVGGPAAIQASDLSTTEWKRFTMTVTVPASGVNQMQFGVHTRIGYGWNPSGQNVDVWGGQVELKSYATPFTASSRGYTVAGGGGFLDLSGNSQNGDFFNAPTWTSERGGAVVTNGNNSYLQVGSPSTTAWSPNGTIGQQNMTMELWFKSSDTGGRLVSKPWNGSGQYNYGIEPTNFNLTAGTTGTTSNSINYDINICDGTWKQVVVWVNSTNMGYYINGNQYSGSKAHGITGAAPSSGNASLITLIGSLYPYGEGWGGNTGFSVAGNYAIFRMYNRVLTAAEVLANFNALRGRFGV